MVCRSVLNISLILLWLRRSSSLLRTCDEDCDDDCVGDDAREEGREDALDDEPLCCLEMGVVARDERAE